MRPLDHVQVADADATFTYNDKTAADEGKLIQVDTLSATGPASRRYTFAVPDGIGSCCWGRAMLYNNHLYLAEEQWNGIVKIDLSTDPLAVSEIAGDGGPGTADPCARARD